MSSVVKFIIYTQPFKAELFLPQCMHAHIYKPGNTLVIVGDPLKINSVFCANHFHLMSKVDVGISSLAKIILSCKEITKGGYYACLVWLLYHPNSDFWGRPKLSPRS